MLFRAGMDPREVEACPCRTLAVMTVVSLDRKWEPQCQKGEWKIDDRRKDDHIQLPFDGSRPHHFIILFVDGPRGFEFQVPH